MDPVVFPDLDLDVRPWCPVCDNGQQVDTDGTSWWCEKCGVTWCMDGTKGERPDG